MSQDNFSQGPPEGGPTQPMGGPPAGMPYLPPPQPPGFVVTSPIPTDILIWPLRSSIRVSLIKNYVSLTQYRPMQTEQTLLNADSVKGWTQLVADICVPLSIWLKTSAPMSEEQIIEKAEGNPRVEQSMRRLYGSALGWSTPARVAACAAALLAVRMIGFSQDASMFDAFTAMQTPLGEYARYLREEGRRGAAAGLLTVTHPPIPRPMMPQYPPPVMMQPDGQYAPPQQMQGPHDPSGSQTQGPETVRHM